MFTEILVESRGARLFAAASLLVALVAVANPIQAAVVDYTVTGTITSSSVSEIPVGSLMTVSYSVEDTARDIEPDPAFGDYHDAITSLSVTFSAGPGASPFYSVVADPDADPTTRNRINVINDAPRDLLGVFLGSSTENPDGSLIGIESGVSMGDLVPLWSGLSAHDLDARTLRSDSIDISQTEFRRFVDTSNTSTFADASVRFVDGAGEQWPVRAVLESVMVSDGAQNTAPVADPEGPYLGAQGSPINFDGSGSSDPDGDSLTYRWDFGDETTATGASPTHSYPAAGIYNVCLVVNDGIVDSTQRCTSAVIYDPTAGFVTGGGWIDSPPGAYVAGPGLSGKATFGFVSKYKKGASTPTGNAQFQFHAGDLNFHSTSYEWLVVTGGDSAVFKGEGSLNGVDGYGFMLWAGDGDLDTFRIKISTDEDTVVYDNGSHQSISHGNVIVHSKK